MSTVTLQQALDLAIGHHKSGRLPQAESLYRQVLARDPNHAQALNLLGAIAVQVGQYPVAIDLIGRAVAIDPKVAEFHNNLGIALRAAGQLEKAIAEIRAAVELSPNSAATQRFLGDILKEAGDLEAAASAYRAAIQLAPDQPQIHNNLGNTLQELGRFEESIDAYRKAIELKPQYPEALANMGNALRSTGKIPASIEALTAAVKMKPEFAAAHNNLANALRDAGQIEDAINSYRRSIELDPNCAMTFHNLGVTLVERHELDDAISAHRKAVELAPDWALAHFNLGVALLQKGDFAGGWPEHEWRLKATELGHHVEHLPQPLWNGEELQGRQILLHTEQGYGDAIQFMRYVPQVLKQNGQVLIRCQNELLDLFKGVEGIHRIVSRDEPAPGCDVQCPLLSLPHVLNTRLDTIPAKVPYLRADRQKSLQWRDRLAPWNDRIKIGLVWAGRATPNPKRSIPVSELSPLADIAHAAFFTLQEEHLLTQAGPPPTGIDLTFWNGEIRNFSDVAALIDNLDLMISIDTAAAHLAGAMGKPVWVLLPHAPDWRWMLDRSDCPWYPTMRLFRQPTPGDWETPLREVVQASLAFQP